MELLNQLTNLKLRKIMYSCDMSDENIDEVFEHVKETIKEEEFISANIHRHRDKMDIEINIV